MVYLDSGVKWKKKHLLVLLIVPYVQSRRMNLSLFQVFLAAIPPVTYTGKY